MPVKTRWNVEHACGHTHVVDLSDRPADRRASYARWLAGRACAECWKGRRDENRDAERAAWLADKRAAEQAEAAAWADRFRMPPLDGSPKATAWAERCRHQLVSAAYTALVTDGAELTEDEWERLEDAARTITRAGWWLDQREADPADLPELLAAATSTDRTTENRYL
jgi:hypothetical protein